MSKNGVRNPVPPAVIFPNGFWKITGIVIACIAAFILVYGFFHARAKVHFPTDSRLEFPTDQYATASERFTQPTGCKLLDQAYFNKKAIGMLGQEMSSDPVRELMMSTYSELRENLVIVRRGHSAGGNFQVLYDNRKTELEQTANNLEGQIKHSNGESDSETRTQLDKIRIQLSVLEALRVFLSELNLKCDFGNLPYTDIPPDIQLICGYFSNLSQDMKIKLRDAAPVLEKSFLSKAGIPLDSIEGVDFEMERKNWEEMLGKAKEKHMQSTMSIRREIDRRVGEQRESVRNKFYTHWFGLLLMAFSTLCTFFVLKRYYRIILRKGLPHKSSFEIYFATNVTSLILRWVALAIVIFGMIELWGFLLLQIFQVESKIPLVPLFNTIAALVLPTLSRLMGLLAAGTLITSLLFNLLAPVALGLFSVLQSWIVLLISEFICFVSNCYHILYNLAHPAEDQTTKTQRDS